MKSAFVAIPEIGKMLGVSRQRASKIIHTYDDFPKPVVELSIGRIWLRQHVEDWAKAHHRRPGRPQKGPAKKAH